jgi:hypothetical protein
LNTSIAIPSAMASIRRERRYNNFATLTTNNTTVYEYDE